MADNKFTLREIVTRLAQSSNIDDITAESFIKAFTDTIMQGLRQDMMVKIKGLGTFKLISVEDRESINVNTGERFTIEGHTKVSFIPDPTLRDEINKPFADFQTVILNPEMDQSKIGHITTDDDVPATVVPEIEEPAVEPVQELITEPVMPEEPVPVVPEESEAIVHEEPEAVLTVQEEIEIVLEEEGPAPVVEEMPAPEELQTEEPQTEEPQTEEPQTEEPHPRAYEPEPELAIPIPLPVFPDPEPELPEIGPEPEDQSAPLPYILKPEPQRVRRHHRPENECRGCKMYHALAALCVLLLCVVSYLAGYYRWFIPNELERAPRELLENQENPGTQSSTGKASNPKIDTLTAEPIDTVQYPQVKGGEYRIVGIQGTHTIDRGQSLRQIAVRYYGDKKFTDYIIVLNNITNPDLVPLGLEIKLPELKKIEE